MEDTRMLTGTGQFTDDLKLEGAAWAVFVRSPVAHARFTVNDLSDAQSAPGVLGVYQASDLGLEPIRNVLMRHVNPDGLPMFVPPRPLLAKDVVRCVGEPVLAVVAGTLEQARDAAELCEVDYDDLPVVTGIEALDEDAPVIWPEAGSNLAFQVGLGDAEKTEAAFASAAHVARIRTRVPRTVAAQLEPRAAVGQWDGERFTLHLGSHTPHRARDYVAADCLGLDPASVRVVVGDLGGSFGMREGSHPEYPFVLWAARELGRPVRWRADRGEGMAADYHARDQHAEAELALDADGLFLAVRARTLTNLGAWLSQSGTHVPFGNVGGLSGPYRTPAIHVTIRGFYSNTAPTAAYRGAGRPEVSLIMESLVDKAAADLGIDRIALRRRNLIQPNDMPWDTGFQFRYDSGDFPRLLDKTLESVAWRDSAARRSASEVEGRLRGVGFAMTVEMSAGPGFGPLPETARLRLGVDGRLTLNLGTQSHGQGHQTAFSNIASRYLGLDPKDVMFGTGDTDDVATGFGSFGSRTLSAGGTVLLAAADDLVTNVASALSDQLDGVFVFEDGLFRDQHGNLTFSLGEAAALTGPHDITRTEKSKAPTFPNAAAVTEVEIDPETGRLVILSHRIVHDAGELHFPQMAHGQLHGGAAQGLAQGLGEYVHYDSEGQLITGSFMDFFVPRASDLPPLGTEDCPTFTDANPLGAKGVGESGTVVSMASLASAVRDAIGDRADCPDMPYTPYAIWKALATGRVAE